MFLKPRLSTGEQYCF